MLSLTMNAGVMTTNLKAELPGYDTVWFDPEAMTNVVTYNKINENDCKMAINKETITVQGPISNNKVNESQKAWTMEMPMMDGDISMTEADEEEQIEESNKKFLYARSVHSNHMIPHHMQQILEYQRVVKEYRSMADGERVMIPLNQTCRKMIQ